MSKEQDDVERGLQAYFVKCRAAWRIEQKEGRKMNQFANGRPRPTNYIGICGTLADSYPQGIPHGVQKDAIQNAIDAVKGSRHRSV